MLDYKKEQKELYQPKAEPGIVDVPQMTFIAVDGKGDPNTAAEYAAAVELLYGLSYGIKMAHKAEQQYVVPPLEGFWEVDGDFTGGGAPIADKSKFIWTMAIRQPDFVTEEIFEGAKAALAKKKPELDTSLAKLITLTEGLCVQIMHVGPYDDEARSVVEMDTHAAEQGYAVDISGTRRHHEIYISDPRKTAPEKLKTVIRHPVRKV